MLPVLGGLAAQIVAPMISQIATGLMQNIAQSVLKGGMPGIGDAFQKIAGGIGQIFGGAQQIGGGLGQLGGLGGLLAGPGMFPGLPGLGGPFMPGCFGPKHPNVDININIRVQDRLGQILQPGNPMMQKMDQMLGQIQNALDGLNKLLGAMGQAPQQGAQGAGNFLEQLGQLLKQFGGAGGAQQGAGAASGGGSQTGGVSSSGGGGSTGGVSSSSGGSREAEFGDKALGSAFDKMDSLEADLDKIDMDAKDAPKKMMQIQQKMQKVQQMINTIQEMRKARHDMIMGISRNIR